MTKVVALSGGVGGARLVHGLSRALERDLTVIVNTGDDFEHWGLHVSPDSDTVMYTLADLAHEERGWGLAEESFETLRMVKKYGGDAWFQLGDRDLATHILRTQGLRRGETLSAVTARLCEALGLASAIVPMADGACRTMIETTTEGTLSFQDWFVRHRAGPPVARVRFEGDPPPAPGVLPAIEAAELVILGPSNPYVSIDPILTRPGVREALSGRTVIAVSPIVGGRAVKGPLGTMIPDLTGSPASAAAIVAHYGGLLSGIVVERGDEAGVTTIPVLGTDTIMRSRADSLVLAREVLAFAARVVPTLRSHQVAALVATGSST
jgi:LPPG:FO 2-phospho-L-lactate transferase